MHEKNSGTFEDKTSLHAQITMHVWVLKRPTQVAERRALPEAEVSWNKPERSWELGWWKPHEVAASYNMIRGTVWKCGGTMQERPPNTADLRPTPVGRERHSHPLVLVVGQRERERDREREKRQTQTQRVPETGAASFFKLRSRQHQHRPRGRRSKTKSYRAERSR